MKKGIDYVGVTVSFYCHDGEGNYVIHKRGANCRDEQGKWDFGGGGLKFGETLEECLLREVMEEYGVVSESYEYLGHAEIMREHNRAPTHWIGFRYRVLVDRSKVINNEPEKHDELEWVTLDQLPSPLHSQVTINIAKYREQLLS